MGVTSHRWLTCNAYKTTIITAATVKVTPCIDYAIFDI